MKLFADSFDIGDLTIHGPWAATDYASLSGNTRFGVGRSISVGGPSNNTSKVFTNSSNVIWLTLAHLPQSATTYQWTFYDGGTPQFTIEILNSNFSINVRNGAVNSTIIASSPTNLYTNSVWHHWQFMIVISKTVGEVHARKDGNPVDDWAVTGINTQNGTANARINQLNLYGGSNGLFDDVLVFDNSGTVPNTWTGDIRALVLYPASVTAQNDFTPGTNNGVMGLGGGGQNPVNNAGTLRMSAGFSPGYDVIATKATLNLLAGATGHANVALYDNANAGNPGNVIATSNTMTNPAAGDAVFTFPTPPLIIAGQTYFLALLADVSLSLNGGNFSTPWALKNGVGYGPFPANPVVSGGQQLFYSTITYTATNYGNCKEQGTFDSDTTFNWANVVGNTDLYGVAALPYTPISVYHAQIRMATRKSDTGARSAQSVLQSGATVDLGVSTIQSSNYTTYIKDYSVDPATGAPWTVSAIQAVKIGCKVSA